MTDSAIQEQSIEKYNRGGLLAFLFSMAFSICFIIYLAFIQGGVDLKENVKDPAAPATLQK
jgi:hypothetical protein